MIEFKKVKYKNLLSTGNQFNEFILDSHPTTLITGDNGAGKSTMLDAFVGVYMERLSVTSPRVRSSTH